MPRTFENPIWPLENDGRVAVDDDAVLAVALNCAGQHGSFDIGAQAHQLGQVVSVRNRDDVLGDDRTRIELLGDVVGRSSD